MASFDQMRHEWCIEWMRRWGRGTLQLRVDYHPKKISFMLLKKLKRVLLRATRHGKKH
jgi:hypothetical protein